jgi:cell wall-associated NlpC family hydrolase
LVVGRVSIWLIVGAVSVGATACASHSAVVARPSPFPSAGPRDGSIAGTASTPIGAAIIQTALDLRGTPYRIGGSQPGSGFDCSGLVRYVFLEHRIDVPRTVAEQVRAGASIDRNKVRPGDLLFFALDGPEPTHVGLVVDNEQFIHAPGTGRVVRVERFTSPYWESHFVGARRLARD